MARGSLDILPVRADWASACQAGVACHMSKNGKSNVKTFLLREIYNGNSKDEILTSDDRYNGKNIFFSILWLHQIENTPYKICNSHLVSNQGP